MGHGKSIAIEDHGYSEILRKLECGCKWWDNTVWLQKPGLMGVRNQQRVFYVCLSYMSMYEYAHTCTCEFYLVKTQTHKCWMLTEELKVLQLWIRWSLLRSIWVYLSYLLPHAPGALMVQGSLEKEPKSTPSRRPSEPCWGVVLNSSPVPKYICCLSCFPG